MKTLKIEQLWASQRNLHRVRSISNLINLIENEIPFSTKIEISLHEDGKYVITNGHHRITALWKSGRREITEEEFDLIYNDKGAALLYVVNLIHLAWKNENS